jgi:hypothetical protein
MKRVFLALLMVGLLAGPAAAIEVRLNDGTVIEAASYTLTGSYIMLELPDGARVAYDIVDVDLDALRQQQQASTPEQPAQEETVSLSQGRRLEAPPANAEAPSGPSITDQDVKHVRGSAAAIAEEGGEQESPAGGPPEGYQQGGSVVINNLQVTAQGEDRWLVEGEVINRFSDPVTNVRVQLQTIAGEGETPWRGQVDVAAMLEPNGRGVFSHGFQATVPEGKAHPDVRASVIWMQQERRSGPPRPPAAQSVPRPPGPVPTPEL